MSEVDLFEDDGAVMALLDKMDAALSGLGPKHLQSFWMRQKRYSAAPDISDDEFEYILMDESLDETARDKQFEARGMQ